MTHYEPTEDEIRQRAAEIQDQTINEMGNLETWQVQHQSK